VHGQGVTIGPDGDQVLLVAHDQGGDGSLALLLHCPPQECVGLVGPLALGRQVVARAEVHRVDVADVDEVGDLDLARPLRLGRLEFFVGEDDVLAAPEIETAHDAVVGDLLAGPLVDLLVADPVRGALLELVEVHGFVGRGRIEPGRDVHKSETEGALPDGAWHGRQITS
jgi:hypothetical protein